MSKPTSHARVEACKLCGVTAELRRSHILPQWAYRPAQVTNQHPVTVHNGVALHTSKQLTAHILCEECEQRLSRDERVVAPLASDRQGNIKLIDHVHPLVGFPDVKFAVLKVKDASALARFAASVFVRMHALPLAERSSLLLWETQAAQLRRFVLGRAPLPERFALNLIAATEAGPTGVSFATMSGTPASQSKGDHGVHEFATAGLVFRLATGTEASAFKPYCLTGEQPLALLMRWEDIGYYRKLAQALGVATPKGALAARGAARRSL